MPNNKVGENKEIKRKKFPAKLKAHFFFNEVTHSISEDLAQSYKKVKYLIRDTNNYYGYYLPSIYSPP